MNHLNQDFEIRTPLPTLVAAPSEKVQSWQFRRTPSHVDGVRVLVVEDNKSLLKTLEDSLVEDGYAVDASSDGEEGLYRALTWDYDLVILDVMLPNVDGFEILRQIRSGDKKNTAVLMLTARDGVDDRVKGLDGGADDYLIKPFKLMELSARIRSLMRRTGGERSPVVEIGAVTINTSLKTVHLDGELVELTALEYNLLNALISQKGKVVSREYLYERLFSEDQEALSNILDVYVCNLRRKIGKDFVKTRRGHGYFIDAD